MKFLISSLGLASVASAHTLFTTLFVNGENQGDGTCVRTPEDGSTATAPIYPLTGDVMACGYDGENSVPFICPASSGSTLTFEFRIWPNAAKPGSIDDSHKGPCSVYIKKVDDMFSDSASGPGWFKIWEDGYNADTDKWCVDTLIENNGLLSVDLPTGLPAGNYLVRPELIALHAAQKGDPQFFHGCAQVFVPNGPAGSLNIPDKYEVSIPGHVQADNPGLTFNLYADEPSTYKMPGPDVYIPESSSIGPRKAQSEGKIPDDCVIKNGNWCAEPVPASDDVYSCWDSVEDCWAQSKVCWAEMPVTGGANCEIWGDYCSSMGDRCSAKQYDGPPEFTAEEEMAPVPGEIPQPYNSFKGTSVDSEAPAEEPVDEEPVTEEPAEEEPVEEEGPEPEVEPVPTMTTLVETAPVETSDASVDDSLLKISEDGRCGGKTGQTCKGSSFGDCCSRKGRCGRKTKHCACGCQSDFGECRK